MAEWKAGRSAEARPLLAKAEALFKEFLAATPDDLGLSWEGAALFEIAINEARTVLSQTNKGNQ